MTLLIIGARAAGDAAGGGGDRKTQFARPDHPAGGGLLAAAGAHDLVHDLPHDLSHDLSWDLLLRQVIKSSVLVNTRQYSSVFVSPHH